MEGVSGLADRLASLQQENAKTSRARIDLYMGLFNFLTCKDKWEIRQFYAATVGWDAGRSFSW